jgi:hypothetical protein
MPGMRAFDLLWRKCTSGPLSKADACKGAAEKVSYFAIPNEVRNLSGF